MKDSSFNTMAILMCVLLATLTTIAQGQGTRLGFYSTTCPRVESIVRNAVQSAIQSDPTLAAGILRLFFHDCFVHGCDGSVLLDGSSSEKTALPNLSLRGFEVIEAAKSQLEATCPGVVSCADITALAARDAVVQVGGTIWQVPLGRRDGLVSQASDAANLPSFNDPISVQIRKFADKGLNTQDLVTLVGGHTIGTASCAVFSYRLYNFNGTNQPDPDINPSFLPQLRSFCPNGGDGATRVGFDTGSVTRFDNSYYANLRNGRGVLESDQMLWNDPNTRQTVQRFLGLSGLLGLTFSVEFGRSMVKMGNIEVKTGSQGEIRRVCRATN